MKRRALDHLERPGQLLRRVCPERDDRHLQRPPGIPWARASREDRKPDLRGDHRVYAACRLHRRPRADRFAVLAMTDTKTITKKADRDALARELKRRKAEPVTVTKPQKPTVTK